MKLNLPDLGYNPYHDTEGKFTSSRGIRSKEHGSRKRRWTREKHRADVREGLLRWEWAPDICGREARKKHRNVRCWDSSEWVDGGWVLVNRDNFSGVESGSGWSTHEKVTAVLFGSILAIQAIRLGLDLRSGKL